MWIKSNVLNINKPNSCFKHFQILTTASWQIRGWSTARSTTTRRAARWRLTMITAPTGFILSTSWERWPCCQETSSPPSSWIKSDAWACWVRRGALTWCFSWCLVSEMWKMSDVVSCRRLHGAVGHQLLLPLVRHQWVHDDLHALSLQRPQHLCLELPGCGHHWAVPDRPEVSAALSWSFTTLHPQRWCDPEQFITCLQTHTVQTCLTPSSCF